MGVTTVFGALLIFNIQIQHTYSEFEIIPIRGQVLIFDEQYIRNAYFEFNHYGPRKKAYVNAKIDIKHPWGNNVSLHAVLFEYHKDEFIKSSYEINYKFCIFLMKDPMAGKIVRTALPNIRCPTPPGYYQLMNMTDVVADYKYELPFYEGRAHINLYLTDTGGSILQSYIDFRINDQAINEPTEPKSLDDDSTL